MATGTVTIDIRDGFSMMCAKMASNPQRDLDERAMFLAVACQVSRQLREIPDVGSQPQEEGRDQCLKGEA